MDGTATQRTRLMHMLDFCLQALEGCAGPIVERIRTCIHSMLGAVSVTETMWQAEWTACMTELQRIWALRPMLDMVYTLTQRIATGGAPLYAQVLRQPGDDVMPHAWHDVWCARRIETVLATRDGQQKMGLLAQERRNIEESLRVAYQTLIVQRTKLSLATHATPAVRVALQGYRNAIQKIGKGTGKRATRYRQDARQASKQATPAIPCWIMPHDRVSETLPAQLGCFDLVIIDEASQSDLTALPAVLRAKKVLIVGDDKQVSPEGIGLDEEKVQHLMHRFLQQQVEAYRAQFSPERSMYDLCKVVFAHSTIMLREHFRCVPAIIEYSKREFYAHELRPLRVPHASERLDPPLIDVWVKDGFRDDKINRPEAMYIVEEIKRMVTDPRYAKRTIGVVSLLGNEQAACIWKMLVDVVGIEAIERHAIACGDARTFQGKERDVVFLSMVVGGEKGAKAVTGAMYAQRFNVATSRARDQMVLVRSCNMEHLSEKDHFRRSLIAHFSTPFVQDGQHVADMRGQCESAFERDVFDALTERGYRVHTQVRVGHYRIDLVVEGDDDVRLAIECDGDTFHGPDRWEADSKRQRILERAGWTFWRCFASTWVRRREQTIAQLVQTLTKQGIAPCMGSPVVRSSDIAHRIVEGMCAPQ